MAKYQKDYYLKIGEVSEEYAIEPHVLRYWEKEFPSLKPKKNRSGQRVYSQQNVALIKKIKNLLYKQRYSIEGAKQVLKEEQEVADRQTNLFSTPQSDEQPMNRQDVKESIFTPIKNELEELLTLLERKETS